VFPVVRRSKTFCTLTLARIPTLLGESRHPQLVVRAAWFAVGLGAVLRIVLFARNYLAPELWIGDATVYQEVAQSLREGRLPASGWIWTPGYSFVGALLSLFVGLERALLTASLLFGIALPALELWIGTRSRCPNAAAVAAVILAFFPDLVRASCRPLTESVATSLLVATSSCAGIAAVRTSTFLAAIAGALGGLGVLTRPELLFAAVPTGIVLGLPHLGGSARRILAYELSLLMIVAPYVVGVHKVSGVWSLSLKPHLTIIHSEVYRHEDTYVNKRMRWAEARKGLLSEDGSWDLRKLAQSVKPRTYFTPARIWGNWSANVVEGFSRLDKASALILAVGVLGLLLCLRGISREVAIATCSLLPVLAVPLFGAPMGRYFLVAVPGLAWNTGAVVARLLDLVRGRREMQAATVAVLFCGMEVFTATEVLREDTNPDAQLLLEINLLWREGRREEAETLARGWAAHRPHDGRYQEILGNFAIEKMEWESAIAAFERAEATDLRISRWWWGSRCGTPGDSRRRRRGFSMLRRVRMKPYPLGRGRGTRRFVRRKSVLERASR
jgi:hypothetical protein